MPHLLFEAWVNRASFILPRHVSSAQAAQCGGPAHFCKGTRDEFYVEFLRENRFGDSICDSYCYFNTQMVSV